MPDDELDQVDLDNLLDQLASSGSRLAVAADGRYRMSLQRRGDIAWLVIEGMVLQAVPDEFTVRLRQLCSGNQIGHAAVDLRRCTYLCSSALGVLALFLQSDRSRSGKVLLLGVSDKIRKMMLLIGLGERFEQVADEAAAARYWLTQDRRRRILG